MSKFWSFFTVNELMVGMAVGAGITAGLFTGVIEVRVNTPFYQSHQEVICNEQATDTEATEILGGTEAGGGD